VAFVGFILQGIDPLVEAPATRRRRHTLVTFFLRVVRPPFLGGGIRRRGCCCLGCREQPPFIVFRVFVFVESRSASPAIFTLL
jgi:hypothetical protein